MGEWEKNKICFYIIDVVTMKCDINLYEIAMFQGACKDETQDFKKLIALNRILINKLQ